MLLLEKRGIEELLMSQSDPTRPVRPPDPEGPQGPRFDPETLHAELQARKARAVAKPQSADEARAALGALAVGGMILGAAMMAKLLSGGK